MVHGEFWAHVHLYCHHCFSHISHVFHSLNIFIFTRLWRPLAAEHSTRRDNTLLTGTLITPHIGREHLSWPFNLLTCSMFHVPVPLKKMIFSKRLVVFLFLDTFESGKWLETGDMTKSLEDNDYFKRFDFFCFQTLLNPESVQKQEK